ncbi:MAG: oligosaccharide flippase family protein [Cyclobacteriaceae bacterium]|nr:oligosaccharide flippase family protein [Cyclobacteriaceae bacterium]
MFKFLKGLRNKINSSYWLRAGSYSLLNKILTTLFAFVNFYILVRLLPKSDFGAYVLFFSVANFLELIKHGFIRNPLIHFLANTQNDSRQVQTASVYLNTIIGLLEVGLLLLCSLYLGNFWSVPIINQLFLIYILSTLALVPVNHLDVVQQARMEFKGTFMSNVTRHGSFFLYILVYFISDRKIHLTSLIYANFFSIVLSGFVSYFFARKFLLLSRVVDREWIVKLFHYGKFTFGTNISSTIMKNIDSWMLGKLISPVAVAIFNPAIRISNLVEVPTDTLTTILFPKLSKKAAEEGTGAARYLYEKSVGTITAIMFPMIILVILLADPIVRIIVGDGFSETVPILRVTMLYGLIIPFNRFLGIVLDATGNARTNFRFVLRNALINIVSNYIFIHQFGIIGAAYGTLTTYTIALIYNQVYLHKKFGVKISGVFEQVFMFYKDIFAIGKQIIQKRIK